MYLIDLYLVMKMTLYIKIMTTKIVIKIIIFMKSYLIYIITVKFIKMYLQNILLIINQ